MNLFDSQSMPLYNFFNNPWAYYIPLYQRQYSWDTDNVTKFMDDIHDGVVRIADNPDYLRFIGTVILYQIKDPKTGVREDLFRFPVQTSSNVNEDAFSFEYLRLP